LMSNCESDECENSLKRRAQMKGSIDKLTAVRQPEENRIKRRFRRILEACVFFVLVFAVLFSVSRLVERKESRRLFSPFLEDPEAYDVLFFGDSRFMNGMLSLELWEDYGIPGYNLSCYGNSLAVTYWSMMNALDYAKPKLVVIGVDGVGELPKITGSSGDLHKALDFLPLSPTKARTIEDLMVDPEQPDAVDDEGNLYRDIKWEFYFKLGKYHNRWHALTADDVNGKLNVKKGGEMLIGITPYRDYEIIDEDVYAEENGHGFAYLRRAIEECRRRGIEVMLVNLLSPSMIRSQMEANTVRSIAEEYAVRYIDLTRIDSVVDYEVDCYDEQPHFNVSGTLKVTDYLGSYIRNHYDLPDRRSDARYDGWSAQQDVYRDEKMNLMRMQSELRHVLLMLHDDDYDVDLSIGQDAALYYDDLAVLLMHNIAREHVLAGEEYEKASSSMYPLGRFDDALWNPTPYYLERRNGIVRESVDEEAAERACGVFGEYDAAAALLNVYDRRTEELVKQFRFE